MKMLLWICVLSLVACGERPFAEEFKRHLEVKRADIEGVIEFFESSGYRKISYGSPDFITFVGHDGEVTEVKMGKGAGGSEEMRLKALDYISKFESAGITIVEESLGLYVTFREGATLLVSEGKPEEVEDLLRGQRWEEVYPGWYVFFG